VIAKAEVRDYDNLNEKERYTLELIDKLSEASANSDIKDTTLGIIPDRYSVASSEMPAIVGFEKWNISLQELPS
jgi:hypothetical protein